jgi:hypothetical protein
VEVAVDLSKRRIPFIFATGYRYSNAIPDQFASVPWSENRSRRKHWQLRSRPPWRVTMSISDSNGSLAAVPGSKRYHRRFHRTRAWRGTVLRPSAEALRCELVLGQSDVTYCWPRP